MVILGGQYTQTNLYIVSITNVKFQTQVFKIIARIQQNVKSRLFPLHSAVDLNFENRSAESGVICSLLLSPSTLEGETLLIRMETWSHSPYLKEVAFPRKRSTVTGHITQLSADRFSKFKLQMKAGNACYLTI